MPKGIPYASSNVIAGVGPEYNIVGNHCFAYSGTVQAASSSSADVECLNFQTGSQSALVRFDYGTDYGGNNDMYIDIQLNGVTVWKTSNTTSNTINDQPLKMVLPPYTNVLFNWGINGVTKNITVLMTGRLLE
jgi:hypothetical protein